MDDAILTKVAAAETETAELDFKSTFDPGSVRDWCELVKDVVAFANSGGGCIAFGVDDDGNAAETDLTELRKVDPATVVDKIQKYTDQHFAGFAFKTTSRHGADIVVMVISGVSMPMIFAATGNYEIGGKQRNAFQQGAVYFRHGAKSEPGTTEDLRQVMEREIDRVRSSWLDGIHKVVTAPVGATISVLPGEVRLSGEAEAISVRLVNDESAPAFTAVRTDLLYPHRQTELLTKVNKLIPGTKISGHDVKCVRKAHAVDLNPTFFYKPQYSSPQYSDAFAAWIVDQHKVDPDFFHKARDFCRA